MNRFTIIILIAFLIGLDSCKKEETPTPEQFPEWLQAKIAEITSQQNICSITDVTIFEYNGKRYYNSYCGLWSCVYCQFFDEKGNRPTWDSNEWNKFHDNQKVIKTVPACK